MANLNEARLIGYLGKDPEVATTQNNIKVVRLSVGTTEKGFTTKQGTQIPDRTEWHDVILWRYSAEFAERYAHKGTQVFVAGKLRHRSYQGKDGVTKYITEVEAEDFQILDRPNQPIQQTTQTPSVSAMVQNKAENDGLPF